MQRWKPSGARLNARPWKEANNGPRIGFDGSYSNSSKRLITGAGSTALWGINHLWTSNKTTTKNGKDRVKYCDHKKGGREVQYRVDGHDGRAQLSVTTPDRTEQKTVSIPYASPIYEFYKLQRAGVSAQSLTSNASVTVTL